MENSKNGISSKQAADRLISAHDGDMALLYIWLKSRSGGLDSAAIELNMTDAQIKAAYEKLARIGLASGEAPASAGKDAVIETVQDDTLPQYTLEDILIREQEDTTFHDVLKEAERCMGRLLSSSEMVKLYGIYDYYAMPYEVIVMLLGFCREDVEKRYTQGRRPYMRVIVNEARIWMERGIKTVEDADEFIKYRNSRYDMGERIKKAVGLGSRKASASQQKYIDLWLELGFDDKAAAEAYDRTVLNTGDMNWPYANSIMSSWHSLGCHTIEEINKTDPPKKIAVAAGKAKTNKPSGDRTAEVEQMLKELEKI